MEEMTPRAKDYYKGKYDREPTSDELNRVLEQVIEIFLEDMKGFFDEA